MIRLRALLMLSLRRKGGAGQNFLANTTPAFR
jgi:hypothetical protein